MERLASAYEADIALRKDPFQEIHAALWQKLELRQPMGVEDLGLPGCSQYSGFPCTKAIRYDWVSLGEAQSLSYPF